MGWGVWAREPERAFLTVPVSGRHSSETPRPRHLSTAAVRDGEVGVSWAAGRSPLPGPGHLGDLEARHSGGGLSPKDMEQVALQFSMELDLLIVDGGSSGLTPSPWPGEHGRA